MAEEAAQQFIHSYYECIDGDRSALADAYGSDSILKFNGEDYTGLQEIGKKIMDLPEMKHSVKAYDALPAGDGITVLTSGTVELQPGKPINFSQSFYLVQKSGGGCFIGLQMFQT